MNGGAKSRPLFYYIVCLSLVDFIAIATTFFVPWYFKIGIYSSPINFSYVITLASFELLFFFLAFSESLYREDVLLELRESLFTVARVLAMVSGLLLLIAFLFKATAGFSRVWAVTWLSLLSVYFLFARAFFSSFSKAMRNAGMAGQRILVVGNRRQAEILLKEYERSDKSLFQIVGVLNVSLSVAEASDDSEVAVRPDIPRYDGLEKLEELIDRLKVDDIVIALPWFDENKIRTTVRRAYNRSVNIYLAPEKVDLFGNGAHKSIGRAVLSQIDRKPIDQWFALLKRTEDVVLSLLAFALVWPILLLIAVAIKLESRGPVLFVQRRYGFNNELIDVFKFRSMYHELEDKNADTQTTRDDNRVTKVGRFIRRTSLDELPQILNVLMGDMSLVGPRPHAIKTRAAGRLFEEVVSHYSIRHRVKPGLTGWAQVNGWRGETDTEEKIRKRVEHDLYYINNWRLSLDLFIILKTIYVVWFSKKNAY